MKKFRFVGLVAILLLQSAGLFAQSGNIKLTLLTANIKGNYHLGGKALQKVLASSGIDLTVKNSEGSYQNSEQILAGKADLAFMQGDMLAIYKLAPKNKPKYDRLKVLVPTRGEVIHILVTTKSGITSMDELRQRNTAIGQNQSGTAFTVGMLHALLYDTQSADLDSAKFVNMPEEKSILQLLKGEIDAAFYVTTINSPILTKIPAGAASKIRLLSLTKQEIPEKIRDYYPTTTLAAGNYQWSNEELEVPFTLSYLVVSDKVKPEVVEKLTKAIYSNLDALEEAHALWHADTANSYKELVGIGVNYHPKVKAYFEKK
jgi:TRAP transporter TAXI family solute receptor